MIYFLIESINRLDTNTLLIRILITISNVSPGFGD